MDWKKNFAEHWRQIAYGTAITLVATGLISVGAWTLPAFMKVSMGWYELTTLVILLAVFGLTIHLFWSHRRLAKERLLQIENERRLLEIQQQILEVEKIKRDEHHRKLGELLSGGSGHTDDLGGAYILLKVKPSTSAAVAKQASKEPAVQYAIAVWGQWDVIIRVDTTSFPKLIPYLTALQNDSNVERTETLIIRSDQEKAGASAREGGWAVLLARLGAAHIEEALAALRAVSGANEGIKISDTGETINVDALRVMHAVGVLGQYDIALTVRYGNDVALAKFVMGYMQQTLHAETITLPAIRNMSYRNGIEQD